jgi:hypothetical protein
MLPQGHALLAVAVLQQHLLRPTHQRRDQQRRQIEIIERLRAEAQRRQQILDRQRRTQPQPVHPRYWHAARVEPRHN